MRIKNKETTSYVPLVRQLCGGVSLYDDLPMVKMCRQTSLNSYSAHSPNLAMYNFFTSIILAESLHELLRHIIELALHRWKSLHGLLLMYVRTSNAYGLRDCVFITGKSDSLYFYRSTRDCTRGLGEMARSEKLSNQVNLLKVNLPKVYCKSMFFGMVIER